MKQCLLIIGVILAYLSSFANEMTSYAPGDHSPIAPSPHADENGQKHVTISPINESCRIYPTIVSEYTTLNYETVPGSNIDVMLHTPAGQLMWQHSKRNAESSGRIFCDTVMLDDGEYIITAIIGNKRYSFKIIKQ